jgi:SAM-dependent methyltransferase
MDDVMRFYEAAVKPGGTFAGQLTEEFQAGLVRRFGAVRREECDFYHTMDFGQGDVVPGVWDLRGRERSYLGWVDVAGQRVLEIGPASGHLTRYMEERQAEVVAFELTPAVAADIVPQAGHDIEAQKRLSVGYTERVRNSWWYAHTRFGSRTRAVYGDIYALPDDLGRFDVALLGSVLLHVQSPFRALEQTATRTDRAVVVTEPVRRIPADEGRAIMEFAPVDTTRTVVVWWQITPGAVIRMLRILGFLEFSVYYHLQRHHPHHEMDKPAEESLYFTVVAERHPGWARRLERTADEVRAEEKIRRQWAPPASPAALEAELRGMRGSVSWRVTRPVRMLGSALRRLGLRG